MTVDWGGIATAIGAFGGFITVVGTFIMQVISYRDERKARLERAVHNDKLDAITSKVDAIAKADANG